MLTLPRVAVLRVMRLLPLLFLACGSGTAPVANTKTTLTALGKPALDHRTAGQGW